MKLHGYVALATASLLACQAHAADLVAWDMVNSTSQNLIDHSNGFENAFSSTGDGAQKYRRGVSASIPFSVLDDSLVSFPADSLGIIDDNNLAEFFGITDTVNNDNTGGDVVASWTFAVAGEVDLAVSIDIGAMGDFEASDTFVWTASIDGGTPQTLFMAVVDEDDSLTYTLAGGTGVTLSDPMTIDGTVLSNVLQNFVAPVSGTGATLAVTFAGNTDGGEEALTFQNLQVLANYEDTTPGAVLSLIHDIQGEGNATNMSGETVTVAAIVVGDFQNNGGTDSGELSGFYVQEEDAEADGNPLTSEGIFVYDGNGAVDVAVGDRVRVTGEAKEFSGLTEIDASSVEILSSGEALPLAATVNFPLSSLDELEALEGMRVRFPQSLVISEYFNYDRFGELVLALPLNGEPLPFTPTAVEQPGSAAYVLRNAQNQLSRITLDDGLGSQNPDTNRHPNGAEFSLTNRFRGGDMVSNATGVMDYRFSLYRIQPTAAAAYAATNPRPDVAPYVGGNLSVASFNVLNYFTTIDEGDDICGPAFNMECRGADNEAEFIRQRGKIISALAELDADIVGLIEIENSATAVSALADSLNSYLGDTVYASLDTGTIGGDAIKVGFIYKPDSVSPVGDHAILDSSVDPAFIDDKNRPALAQTFQANNRGRLTVVINHLKSKGSDCEDVGDADLGDGQGNCNLTRTAAAVALADWLITDPTGSNDEDFLILGDLNSYAREDPIAALEGAGFTDLIAYFQGEFTYSYVFDGQFGYLDYAMANTSLKSQITGTDAWHINADEPDLLDYDTSFKSPYQVALYAPDAFRSSDHDPILVGLNLTTGDRCQQFSNPRRARNCQWVEKYWQWKKKWIQAWWEWHFSHNPWLGRLAGRR